VSNKKKQKQKVYIDSEYFTLMENLKTAGAKTNTQFQGTTDETLKVKQ
jgi:hypothetical protein